VIAAIDLAYFMRDTFASDTERARYSAFVRQVFGRRARTLGFAPRSGESDDDQLVRRALIEIAAPEDPRLAAEARRLARAWMRDRKAIDPGVADKVLVVAAQTGDASLLETMRAEAKATTDRLDRRNLLVAVFSFDDPALAQRGLALLLDPDLDIRELTTALRIALYVNPPRRAIHDFMAANFDALAKRVARDTPGGWPMYASLLCSDKDRVDVEAFWRERIGSYAGGDRELAQALEAIELCVRVREAQQENVRAFLANH
jgi:alanyl aminopeptidase